MSGGRPRSMPIELQAVIAANDVPVASEVKRDLVRFMLPILAPQVNWDAVDHALAEGRQSAKRRQQNRARKIEEGIKRLQEERLRLLREIA